MTDARVRDVHRLGLPGRSFDLATGGFVIHLVTDPRRVLAELRRVLRPGATLALTTPGPREDHGRWEAFEAVRTEFAPRADVRGRPAPVDVPDALQPE